VRTRAQYTMHITRGKSTNSQDLGMISVTEKHVKGYMYQSQHQD
jgi:hypothetical protein